MVKTNSEYVFFKYGQDDNQSNIEYEINKIIYNLLWDDHNFLSLCGTLP